MKRILSVGLLTIMLSVTLGLPVYKHTCHIFDRSELSFVSQDPCCSPQQKKDATPRFDVSCCSLEHFDTTLDYETLVEKSIELSTAFALDVNYPDYPLTSFDRKVTRYHVQRPPPTANRALLNQIQVYRL